MPHQALIVAPHISGEQVEAGALLGAAVVVLVAQAAPGEGRVGEEADVVLPAGLGQVSLVLHSDLRV